MKETLVKESDRNTVSPTESTVCGREQREHSGADFLNRPRNEEGKNALGL